MPEKQETRWLNVSKPDHRWVCGGCYLQCVVTSLLKPTDCRRESQEAFNKRYKIVPDK